MAWLKAKKATIPNKESATDLLVRTLDDLSVSTGHGGLKTDTMDKEEMRTTMNMNRQAVVDGHNRSERAVSTWQNIYDRVGPSYLLFCATGMDPRLKQLEEALALVDECERDFAADLAHFEAKRVEEDATRASLSTPGAQQGAILLEESELTQCRVEAARDDIRPSQARLIQTRAWADDIRSTHNLQLSQLLKRPSSMLRTLLKIAGRQGFNAGRHVLLGPRATLPKLQSELITQQPRVLIINALGGGGNLFVNTESNETMPEGNERTLGEGSPSVIEPSSEALLDAVCPETTSSCAWRPMLVLLNCGHSATLGEAMVYRGIPCVICWRGDVHSNAMQAFSNGLISALEMDASAACAFTSARQHLVQSFASGRLMKEGDPILDEDGRMVPHSPHGTPLLITADEKGLLRTFSHEHPNGLKGDAEQPVIVSGMSIKDFVSPVIGMFGIVSPGQPQDARVLQHEVSAKETWQAMCSAGVATSSLNHKAEPEVYDAQNNLWVPADHPRPGQVVADTLGLLPGGYLTSVLRSEHHFIERRGRLHSGMLPKEATTGNTTHVDHIEQDSGSR